MITALATGLRALATADTGTGGLFNSSSPLLTGFYTEEAPQNAVPPYAVMSSTGTLRENVFDNTRRVEDVGFQIGVTSKRSDVDPDNHSTIVERMHTVFDRVAPTVTGWTASQCIPEGRPVEAEVDGNTIYTVLEYSILLDKN